MSLSSLYQRRLLWRYILRAHIGPFLFSFFTLMFLFLLQFVMKFVDELVGKGLSAWVVLELIALNLAWMVVLAVPMSILVATLMAFGDMSSKNEITAMKAAGTSLYRMIAPIFAASVLIAAGLVYFNNSVLPDANHRLKNLASDIRRKKPTLSLVNGVFSQDIPGYSILVRRAVPKTNDLVGVTIYDFTNPSSNVVITARRGTVSFSPDYRRLIMDLQEGEIHELDLQNQNSYRRVRFEKHRIAMDVQGFDFERTAEAASQRGDRELSARAMQVFVDSLSPTKAALEKEFADVMRRDVELRASGLLDAPLSGAPGQSPPAYLPVTTPLLALRQTQATVTTYMFRLENLERQLDQYEVEINKKYSIPAACIVFVFVGVPLGIMSRRGGFGVAATLSLGFFILYWACLIGGEKLADRDIVQPFVGMWIANVLIGLFGVYLTFRIGRETILIDWSFLHRLVPRRWRDRLQDEMPEPEVEA
jgi:lipopolysaccharide export system permease protein